MTSDAVTHQAISDLIRPARGRVPRRQARLSHDWMIYMYDFGDSWEHKVTLQKILPYDPTVRLPACISGRRRCPPEDCGGVWGYYEMLDSLKHPNARDHEHMKEWVGGHYDPEAFSPQAVDMILGKMKW